MVKVVISRYSSFRLSFEACQMLLSKGWSPERIDVTCQEYPYVYDNKDINFRTHPDVISVVETLEEVGLEVVEVPDDVNWYIDSCNGAETIREKHRTW